MPGAAPEHQGHLGDLHTKSTTELMDLLRRQEAILQKQNFLRSLPDGGRKVRAFADTLHRIITEKKRQEVEEVSQMVDDMEVGNTSTHPHVEPATDGQPGGSIDSEAPSRRVSQFAKLRDKRLAASEMEGTSSRSSLDAEFCSKIQALTVRDRVLPGNEEADGHLAELINNPHPDKVVTFGEFHRSKTDTANSYLKVMQRSEQAAANTKQRFKPNSTLKLHSLEELPEKYRGKGAGKTQPSHMEQDGVSRRRNPTTQRIIDNKNAESSATPPKYEHGEVKLIPLEESFQLQKTQASKKEELRAQHAAERLAGKFHVKMGRFNPEGEMFTTYRSRTDDDLDSDDCEEQEEG